MLTRLPKSCVVSVVLCPYNDHNPPIPIANSIFSCYKNGDTFGGPSKTKYSGRGREFWWMEKGVSGKRFIPVGENTTILGRPCRVVAVKKLMEKNSYGHTPTIVKLVFLDRKHPGTEDMYIHAYLALWNS